MSLLLKELSMAHKWPSITKGSYFYVTPSQSSYSSVDRIAKKMEDRRVLSGGGGIILYNRVISILDYIYFLLMIWITTVLAGSMVQ
jgi:hypothetical protein